MATARAPGISPMTAAIFSPSTAPVKRSNHTIGPPIIQPPSLGFPMLQQLPRLTTIIPAIPRLNTVMPSARPPAPVDNTPLVVSGIAVNAADLISFGDLPPRGTDTGIASHPRPRDIFDSPVMVPEVGATGSPPIPIPLPNSVHKAPNAVLVPTPMSAPQGLPYNNPLLAVNQPILLSSPVSTVVSPQSTVLMSNDNSLDTAPIISAVLPPTIPTPAALAPTIPTSAVSAPTPVVFSPVQPAPVFTWSGIDQQVTQSPQPSQLPQMEVPMPLSMPQPTEVWRGSGSDQSIGVTEAIPPVMMNSHADPAYDLTNTLQPFSLPSTQYVASHTVTEEPATASVVIGNPASSIYTVRSEDRPYHSVNMRSVTTPVHTNSDTELYRPMIMSTTPPAPGPTQSIATTLLTSSNVYRLPIIGVSGAGVTSTTVAAPVLSGAMGVQTPMYQAKLNTGVGTNAERVQQQHVGYQQNHTTTPTPTASQPQIQQQSPQLNLVPAMNHPAANLPEQEIPNYAAMPLEKQAQYRADFITKFGILRNSWKEMGIPDVAMEMGLSEMHTMYNTYVRQIHIQQNVDSYKQYIVAIWWILEVLGNKAGLNISGYAQSQMNSMSKYEKLLIELGENKYKETSAVAGGVVQQSQWPVELRLLGVALLNALIFVIVRTCVSYLGMDANVVQQVLGFFSGQNNSPQIAQIAHQAVQGNNNGGVIPDPPMPNQGGLGGMLGNLLPGFLGNILGGNQSGSAGTGGAPNGLAGLIGQIAGSMMGQGNVQQPQQAAQPILANSPLPATTPTPTPATAANGTRQRRTPQFAQ